MQAAQNIIDTLLKSLPSIRFRSGPEVALLDPGIDPLNLRASHVAFPKSTAEVAMLMRVCNETGVCIVPHGGRTGLAGGATSESGQLVISLTDMRQIESIDGDAALAIVEAGVTLGALQEAAKAYGLTPGIDLGARDSATIGGMISTNAGGIEAFRNGTMRSRILGLESVLADGTIVSDLSQVAKCNEGYDIKQLMIGAEGTLGIVTRAVVRLTDLPKAKATAVVGAQSCLDAIGVFHALKTTGNLLAFELMNRRYFELSAADHAAGSLAGMAEGGFAFIIEMDGASHDEATANLETGLSALLEQGFISDAILAKSDAEAQQFWTLREDSWCVDRKFPGGLWYDVSIPLGAIDGYLDRLDQDLARALPNVNCYVIGHLGDGNLHLTIAGPEPLTAHYGAVSELVFDGIKALGGSISAEHGIGTEKRAALAKYGDPGKRAMMLAIKQALDPKGIMNPGKVL